MATAAPVTVSVGHQINCTIEFLDQNGQPMLTEPTPDAVPVWTLGPPATPPVDALTVAANGLTATDAALAPGADTISVDLKVGGVDFAASVGVDVTAAPQVLTSIALQTAVQ